MAPPDDTPSFAECGSSFGKEAPSAHETPSGDGCSSSSVPKEHDPHQNVDLDGLIQQISELLEFYKKKSSDQKPRTHDSGLRTPSTRTHDYWPSSTFLNLKEWVTGGIKIADTLKDTRSVLEDIGHANLAAAGLLVVSNILKRFEDIRENQKECLCVLEEMANLAKHVNQLKERPRLKEEMTDPIQEATELIVNASIMCSSQMDSSIGSKLFLSRRNKRKLKEFQRKLRKMFRHMDKRMIICVYDAIDYRKARKPLPRERAYPTYAVGIDERLKEVTKLLDVETENNALAVLLHGFGGVGKTTLADAVFARVYIKGCKYSMVRLFDDITSTTNIVDLQKCILEDLMREPKEEKEDIPHIRTFDEGQREIGRILEKEAAFIYIDNAFHRDVLEQLMPLDMTKVKNLRLLITSKDKDVLRGCRHLKKKVYDMKCLDDGEARDLLEKEMKHDIDDLREQINSSQLNNIIQICGGIPRLLISIAGFISFEEDKKKTCRIIIQDKEKLTAQLLRDIEHYVFPYDSLPEMCKDPFLDICLFFKGWDWNTVADIVGETELDMLEKRALVIKDINRTVNVHNVILTIGIKKAHGSRFNITNAKQLDELLRKDMQGIKGLWFKENKDLRDIPATKLNSVYNSLRILELGNFTKVTGKCTEKFEKLVFFQGEVCDLPFSVCHLKELRYLNFQPQDLKLLTEMHSNLRHVELDGKGLTDVLEISSVHLQHFRHLRVLKLVRFKDVKKLPQGLGSLTNGLQELILSYCSSLHELPRSISNLQYLKILKINHCSNLSELPKDLTLLKYLQELNVDGCDSLSVYPKLDVAQWKRVILNEEGCVNLKMYLRSLELPQFKRFPLSEEDCECDKVYLESLDLSGWKKQLLNEEEGCESVKVYVDSWDELQSLIPNISGY